MQKKVFCVIIASVLYCAFASAAPISWHMLPDKLRAENQWFKRISLFAVVGNCNVKRIENLLDYHALYEYAIIIIIYANFVLC